MRLIDADALIEELREIKTLYGVPITKRDEQMVHWVIGHINNQPTAYDVDAVVESLEKESYRTTDLVCGGLFEAIRLSSAINIVKKRGDYV